jgi:hypothetical protein
MTDSGRPIEPPTDDAICEMLESRASRVHPSSIDLATIVAAAGPRAPTGFGRALRLAPRLSLVASTFAAVLVAFALIVVPLFNRPMGSATPSGLADASGATGSPSEVGPSSAPTSSIRLLTPAEIGELARTRSRELSTKVAAVRGRLALDVPGCSTCANATFAGGDFGVRVRILGSLRTSWGTSSARTSAWVIRFTPEVENGLPIVEALGELRTGMSGGLTSTVTELLYDEVGAVGSYAAVDGWLIRTPLHPCASFVMPSDAPTDLPSYGCPEDDYLTDTEFQPTRPDGSSRGPAKGILLPVESYAKWAPNPAQFGSGFEPRRATFLLQLVDTSPCGPTDYCLAGPLIRRWQITARLEPIPNIATVPTSSPSLVPVPLVAWWRVADLAVPPLSAAPGDYQVHAYLVRTPPLKCLAVSAGLPNYSCDEIDWLTDEPFQPWVADGNSGGTREPSVGLRVQNGAYDAFASDPARGPFGAWEPRLGDYLVRRLTAPACIGRAQSSGAPCYGGTGLHWEITARLP